MANNNHFDLTLDTTAPEGSVKLEGKAEIYTNKALTITKNNDAVYMKLWFDTTQVETETDIPEDAEWIAADTTYTTKFLDGGTYYYHMVLMDAVGNQSEVYTTPTSIVYDPEDPVIDSVTLPTITAEKEGIKYTVVFHDLEPSSGVTSLNISYANADGTYKQTLSPVANPVSGTEYQFDFDNAAPDGTYTFTYVVVDLAGNESAPVTKKIILNTTSGNLILSLLTTDETATALPNFINYHAIQANLKCTDDLTVTGYKVWEEGTTEPETYTAWTEGTALDVTVPMTLSANDGLKTVHAKMINTASTEISATDQTVTVDSVAPVITLTSDKTIISEVTGYDTAVLTITGSDALAGIKYYKLVRGTAESDPNVTSGTDLSTDVTFNLTKASGGLTDDGTYTFTLFVNDNAENQATATVNVILDTTNPTLTLSDLTGTDANSAGWYRDVIENATTEYSDTNNVAKLYAWVSTVETDTAAPASSEVTPVPTSPYIISATVLRNTWSNATQGTGNYLHVQAVDMVGNTTTVTKSFKLDSVAPSGLSASFSKTIYKSGDTGVLNLSAVDVTSHTTWLRVTGNIANPTVGTEDFPWEPYSTTRDVTFSDAGTVTVTVQIMDAAGNIDTDTVTATCEYDPENPYAKLVLRKPDDSDVKETPTPVSGFIARVSGTDDGAETGIAAYYQLYGDYSVGSQGTQAIEYVDDDAHWIALTYDEGQQYKTINNLFLNAPDGIKHIYLRVKDDAGNISEEVPATVELDTEAPVATVSDIDYQRISKTHTLRRSDATTTIADKYNDQMHFTFTPDSLIQAYKVCAYTDKAAAEAVTDVASEKAIPQLGDTIEGLTPASTNMHGNGLNQSTAVSCMIAGADFEYALGGVSATHEFDGAHLVVVYVQDLAGTWSEAADFSA